jgi:ATP-binding cassette, subfamily B, bacterial
MVALAPGGRPDGCAASAGTEEVNRAAASAVASPARVAYSAALRRQRVRVALVGLLTAGSTATSLATPALLAAAVDAALHARTSLAALALGAVILVESAATALSALLGAKVNAGATAQLRHRIVHDVLARGIREPARAPVGDVLSRLNMDAAGVGAVVSAGVHIGVSVVMTVGALVALVLVDWLLVVVFLAGALVLVLLLRTFVGQVSDVFVRYRKAQAAMSARLIEALTGARSIRASATLSREVERVLGPARDLAAAGRDSWQVQRSANFHAQLVFPALELAMLTVAGIRLVSGAITPGELLAVVGYVRIALGMFDRIDDLFSLGESQASAGRAGELLGVSAATGRTAAVRPRDGSIDLLGVSVDGAPGGRLSDVGLHIPAGQSVAVVGHTGAGQATLALVAGGLIEPDRGTVRLGGVPLAEIAPTELRGLVAYAFDRPELLGDTVHDVIAFGAPGSPPSAVIAATTAAQAHHFVSRLPYGYQTHFADVPLSGGEAQRLGLARAFAQGRLVLILDDATASLDTATEARVAAALRRFHGERTCLLVTNRPATAARADRVAWLDGGRLRAVAPHHLLWAAPEYQAIFDSRVEEPSPAGRDVP